MSNKGLTAYYVTYRFAAVKAHAAFITHMKYICSKYQKISYI